MFNGDIVAGSLFRKNELEGIVAESGVKKGDPGPSIEPGEKQEVGVSAIAEVSEFPLSVLLRSLKPSRDSIFKLSSLRTLIGSVGDGGFSSMDIAGDIPSGVR